MPVSSLTGKVSFGNLSVNSESSTSSSQSQTSRAATNRSDAVSISGLASKANDAISAIFELRDKQQTLVDASENATDAARDDIQTELDNIQTEITRIATEASYHDVNPLEGGVFTVQASGQNFASVISIQDLSSFGDDYGLDVSTFRKRAIADTDIENLVLSLDIATSNVNQSVNNAEDTISALSASSPESLGPDLSGSGFTPDQLNEIAQEIIFGQTPETDPQSAILTGSAAPFDPNKPKDPLVKIPPEDLGKIIDQII